MCRRFTNSISSVVLAKSEFRIAISLFRKANLFIHDHDHADGVAATLTASRRNTHRRILHLCKRAIEQTTLRPLAMSLFLLRRCLRPLLSCELPARSVPTLSPSRRWYRDDREASSTEEWSSVSQSLPMIFKTQSPEERWADNHKRAASRIVKLPTAYSGLQFICHSELSSLIPMSLQGRSVAVKSNDIGEAARKLDRILVENNVWKELRLTQRHEKKGAKRRRLSSERWRARFKEEVSGLYLV